VVQLADQRRLGGEEALLEVQFARVGRSRCARA
jgi:hypothetical protein